MTSPFWLIFAGCACVVTLRAPHWLLPLALVAAVFEGAAVVVAGGVALSPYYFVLLCIAARCVFMPLDDLFGATNRLRRLTRTAAVMCAVCVGGSVLLPRLFAGTLVYSPRLGEGLAAPLEFSTGNVAQSAYLTLNLVMIWYAVRQAKTLLDADRITRALFIAGGLVVTVGLWQLAAVYTGVPYPSDVLYSNPTFVIREDEMILGMPRISSTFTETAGLSTFLIGLAAFLGRDIELTPRRRVIAVLMLLLTLGLLMLSTSSTAYVGLAGLTGLAVLRYVVFPLLAGRGSVVMAVLLVLLVAGGAAAIFYSENGQDMVQKMVLDKSDSESYRERHASDVHGWQLMQSTLGLGVGLGSNRASAFLPSMFSTVGVAGATCLAWLLYQHLLPLRQRRGTVADTHRSFVIALLAVLAAKAISSPDMSTPILWVLLASVSGLIAVDEKTRAAAWVTDRAEADDHVNAHAAPHGAADARSATALSDNPAAAPRLFDLKPLFKGSA